MAAMRTSKIDAMDSLPFNQAQIMQKSNPEIKQLTIPAPTGVEVDPRNDKIPFNDIRVRKAMQMALDLPTIAATYYGGTCSADPVALTSMYLKGYGFPYTQWPQDLKNEYTYNPTQAKQLLAASGYPNGFNTNIVADSSGDMDLLQVVKSYFADVNINMSIRTMDSATWTTYVQTGRNQDQLAVRTYSGQLGMKYEPLRALNKFQTGYSLNYLMVSDPVFDAFYPKAMATTTVGDALQVLKDANEYVARQHLAISLVEPMNISLVQPWLKGYNGQYGAFYGTAGPTELFFYGARFWIDQNLKK
jgi:ABC-type transport system substrate-binding protein